MGIALVVTAEEGDDQVAEQEVEAERDEGGKCQSLRVVFNFFSLGYEQVTV